MDPVINATLGLLFIASGVAATVVMYHLRGGPVGGKPAGAASPKRDDTAATDDDYLAAWRRTSDDVERHMTHIHTMASTGRSIVEPMRTRRPTVSWDELLLKGAQLARLPLNEDEAVATETVIGPAARVPLVIATPMLVSHMSFGALSREIKIALARGAAAVETAICSGEGGILEDELLAAHKFIFEYVPNRYSATEENLRRVDAVEIKIGQAAKPGMGGHLPGDKVTDEIARVRERPEGVDIVSPARFDDVRTPADLRRTVDWLREQTGGKPIGVKLAAGNVEADLEFALQARPDFVTLDGRGGATGAAPKMVKDATSAPTVYALSRARKWLDRQGADSVSLVITGGLRVSADMAKALALGADAVALATAALMAAGCQQYRICQTGRCPVGVTSQDPELRSRVQIDRSAGRLENYLRVSTEELKMFARLTGRERIDTLSVDDLCCGDAELAARLGIERV